MAHVGHSALTDRGSAGATVNSEPADISKALTNERCKVKNKILSIMAVLAMLWGGAAMRGSIAQTTSQTPMEHGDMGEHHMAGPSDGAFHRKIRGC